jgi:hypothetical protein
LVSVNSLKGVKFGISKAIQKCSSHEAHFKATQMAKAKKKYIAIGKL